MKNSRTRVVEAVGGLNLKANNYRPMWFQIANEWKAGQDSRETYIRLHTDNSLLQCMRPLLRPSSVTVACDSVSICAALAGP